MSFYKFAFSFDGLGDCIHEGFGEVQLVSFLIGII